MVIKVIEDKKDAQTSYPRVLVIFISILKHLFLHC